VEKGARLSAADYVDALAAQKKVQGDVGAFFDVEDLILSPVTGSLPGPADVPAQGSYTVFTGFANTAGIPAISVPAGFSPGGLPIGVHLVGRFGADLDLLRLANEYEKRHPWRDHWPSLAVAPGSAPASPCST
jgi:aspartyl-tRNA(Asn)/glutamyl-tRNA(Gln) amidotransferase subunit A